jgi:short-subunit dehydrogenase
MRWENAVIVITGGSSGIGLEVGRQAARRGARVGLVARREDELAHARAELGGRGAYAVADVGDLEQLADAMRALSAELGPVDVLVCNAGVGAYGCFRSSDPADVERLVRTNVLGAMNATRTVLDGMVERRSGHVVYVGSIAGHVGVPLEAADSATKCALTGFADALAVELAPHGVGVSLVSPGPVATGFYAARGHPYARTRPRLAAPEAVAAAVLRAVERRRADVILPARLRVAAVVRALAPSLYRWGARRAVTRTAAP